ncbi:MAG: S8 family peptidase [Sciscionella sp.]
MQNVLKERKHEFFNISLGPALPVEDDEVHSWTAVLDEHLSDGASLASIAIGNNGEEDRASGEARIQVPGDCVNALSVGAADSSRSGWSRARYSAVGPGRSPGRIKPDIIYFGGDGREPFIVYDVDDAPRIAATVGTSFASPAALRCAVGLRAHFGDRITPLGLKALLVHQADRSDKDPADVGWGAIRSSIDDFVVCRDRSVRVLYQGELNPAQYLRAIIPLPQEQINGLVTLTASFCYATPTDPQDPGSYTKSGLEVVFRPHAAKYKEGATEPTTRPFFQRSQYDTEHELRNDAQKWEPVMRASHNFQGKSLFRPVFDIHYNARSAGGSALGAERIRYALVVSVSTKKDIDLYEIVAREYAGRLEALQPRIDIPIMT